MGRGDAEVAGWEGPRWCPSSRLDGATRADSSLLHPSGFGLAGGAWGGNASPLQLVWIHTHASPALLTAPSLLALPLCPSSRDLLVQIGAKSLVLLGKGQSQGFFSLAKCCFILWTSSPSPSALHYRHRNPAREAFKN